MTADSHATPNFSLDEAAVMICGSDSTAKREWVRRRLRRGDFQGYKVGRDWRMTDEDIAAAIESLRPKRAFVPELPTMSGLTRTSARRLAS